MQTETFAKNLADLQRSMAEFSEFLNQDAQPSGKAKPRVISKMAKNVQHGEIVELPHFGRVEVGAWSRMGDRVLLGDGAHKNESFHVEQRVRVFRA